MGTKILKFLQGKKTYFCAGAIALAAIAGWHFGAISDTNATALLAIAGAAAGLGAKSQRNAELVMAALETVKARQAGHERDLSQLTKMQVGQNSMLGTIIQQVQQHQGALVDLAQKVEAPVVIATAPVATTPTNSASVAAVFNTGASTSK